MNKTTYSSKLYNLKEKSATLVDEALPPPPVPPALFYIFRPGVNISIENKYKMHQMGFKVCALH